MKKNPLFSIIVLVYNTEKYLKECLDSILNQTFKDFQLILVDDGSTDSSPNICDEYKLLYSDKIEVIHKKNEGQLASRIRGLELAKGEYIYYVDSDDTIDPSLFNDVYNIINSYKPDIVLLNFQYINEQGKVIEINNDNLNNGYIEKEVIFDFVVKEKINPLWRKIFKKDLLRKDIDFKKYYHIKNGEDLIQSLPILCEAKSFYYFDKPYYNYRDTPFNISKNYNITRVNAIVYKMQLIDQCLSSIDFDTNENKINLFSHYFEMLWIGLFNYFFYCNKNNIKEDLSFLHSGFIEHKHWLKHIKLSLLKKIGFLLFFWKQWLLLKIYYYFVYIFYSCGIKKLKEKFLDQ